MVIADTGFWIALANRRDKHHEIAKQRFTELSNRGELFITTWPVMTETCHLLLHRMGHAAQCQFIEHFHMGSYEVFEIGKNYSERIKTLMKKYAELPIDLADASLVILAENLGHGRILSTDQRDFLAYRWKQHEPFQNLLMP